MAIAVQDTGAGIPPENMAEIFEPLFTTKAKGGRIEVQSEPEVGSTFTVVLPSHEKGSAS